MATYGNCLTEVRNNLKGCVTYFINKKRVSKQIYLECKANAYRIDSFLTELKSDKLYQHCICYNRICY